ncbi:MAG: hypothetical protein F6J97_26885 [Leptolyngbya sp. SIO4C1]|nr:hypothetical protein [Leptolyngbya sp. SIO4C1]
MFSQSYYLLRSKLDGQYLVARPRSGDQSNGFLMLFTADYDALSYLNRHGAEVADRFGVESISGPQLKQLMDRWGFDGVGMVNDPLVPQVEFLRRDRTL